jgi:2-dehydro-3-deoxy-L-rhamnonate dehydrogenase (NAD+)
VEYDPALENSRAGSRNARELVMDLDGQVAIVTGGARGIGLGISRRLAADGARVVIWDVDPSGFDDQKAGFRPAHIETVDVSLFSSVEKAAASTQTKAGPAQILVNNAGISGPTEVPVWDYPVDAWNKVIAINLTGVFNCSKVIAPQMMAGGYGRVVNIASVSGKQGRQGIAAYASSKAGVIALTKSMGRELAGSGVLVNCITPSMAETDLFLQMSEEHIQSSRKNTLMGRFLTVPEIAEMVAWIAGPRCTFSTGAVFDISGGGAVY